MKYYLEVSKMTQRDYGSELYEQMKSEQNMYRDWLLTLSPSEILSHANEYSVREDIVMAMDELELSPKRAKALLKSPCPLGDVFKEFRDMETERMDEIRSAIESRADAVIKRENARESR